MSRWLLSRNRKGNFMPRLRTRKARTTPREKKFREKPGIPLDGNAKARIWSYVKAYNAKHRTKGQHCGPITWAFFRVLRALLFGFHNSDTGHCFPSYETIAEAAQCCRDTVYAAIHTLEAIGVLDWVNRFDKIYQDGWQVIRTSNAYLFRDPLPCATSPENYKSENPAGTLLIQEKILTTTPKTNIQDLDNSTIATLIRYGKTIGAIAA
jgi:Helix-turn-helix domain